ncbi:MAG: GEVED domain-containing protein [Ferruginibacter sp.]|nr:T9SS type A sorting domain-containing protein [Ferruginibacter sp.]
MKKIYIFLLTLLVFVGSSYAQINAYTFAGSSGTYSAISGTTVTLAGQDDNSTGNLPIGFSFTYNGVAETVFAASTNGLLILGQTTNGTGLSGNGIATASKVIAGFWDDNNMTGGNIQYSTTGVSPNQVLTVQYTAMHVGGNGSTTTPTLNMQILLYEGTNQIQIIYGSTSAAISAQSASIGIASGTTNFISVTPTSTSTPFATTSTTVANNAVANSTNIPSGITYTFVPPVPCTGTPSAGTATTNNTSACSGTSVNLNLTGSTSGVTGLTYQWQSSPASAGTFTNISGATTMAFSATVSANTDYQCVVTCTNGGATSTSTIVSVSTISCLPNYTTTYSTGISYSSISSTGTSATWQGTLTNGDDFTTTDITIPFDFVLKGNVYTKLNACTNGWLAFGGSVTSTNTFGGLSSATISNALIAPFGEDLVTTGNTSVALATSFKYQTLGTTPNRIFVVEWIGMERYLYPGPNLNFQVKLYETSNKVEIVYGTMEGFNGTVNNAYTYSVGLRKSNTDYIALQAQNSNYFTTTDNNALKIVPECNTMYTFDPNATLVTGTAPVAAAPANDEPAGAITVSVNAGTCLSYCGTYYQTIGATASAGITVCSATTPGTPDDDVWFKFVATNASQTIAVFGAAGYDAVLQAFSDAGTTSIGCVNATATSITESLALTGLTVGNTYYVRVYHLGIGNGTTSQLSICVSAPPPPPANDNPCGAVVLTPSSTCTPYTDNTTNSTTAVLAATTTLFSSTGNAVAAPSCTGAGTNVNDVWFKFTATGDVHGITVTAVPGFDVALQAFSQAGTCGGDNLVLTNLGCVNGATTGGTENVTFTTTIGTEYYLRIYRHPSGVAGAPVSNSQFSICVFNPTPLCTTNTTPADLASGVSTSPALIFNRVSYASSYDVYIGATAATATLSGNVLDPGTGTTATYNVTPALTTSTTYFWYVVPKNSNGSAANCSTTNATSFTTSSVLPPPCVSNTTPANLATNVATIPNLTLVWASEPTATAYDVYIGTVNPPTVVTVANVTATTVNLPGAAASTTYYWYIVPKNAGGNATGCVSNVTSFTTSAQCNPSTTNGGEFGDALTDFVLNGEGVTAISVLGAVGTTSPGYIDMTATTTVDLAPGKAYAGYYNTEDVDRLTIWIDADNNGGFEASEKVLNDLPPIAGGTQTAFSILIPTGLSTGTHKMRVRTVWSTGIPAAPTTACSNYGYGESRDFTVNIVASGANYAVSAAGAGACAVACATTIDAVSNNNNTVVPLLDASGAIIASVNALGNNLGKVSTSIYKNTGAVRQDASLQYYLDRNITITPTTQPASNVNVRLFYSLAELTALQAVVPAVTSGNVIATKTAAACVATYGGATPVLVNHGGDGTLGSDYFLDATIPSFSTFFIHGGSTVLPVGIEYFAGSKQAATNVLDWKVTCNSALSLTLSLERSANGKNFTEIQNQTATATRCLQAFNAIDAAPLAGINYYRLKVTENGVVRYSTIVALLNKASGFELISLAPNPVKNTATLSLTSAKAGKVDVVITDLVGKVVTKQTVVIIAGNNPIPMNFATLGAGTYSITVKNAEGEVKTTRFVKY